MKKKKGFGGNAWCRFRAKMKEKNVQKKKRKEKRVPSEEEGEQTTKEGREKGEERPHNATPHDGPRKRVLEEKETQPCGGLLPTRARRRGRSW